MRLQQRQRRRRVAGVDGVGQLPRRHAAGLAEERLDVAPAEAPAVAERGGQRGQEAVEAADVLAEALGDASPRAGVDSRTPAAVGLLDDPALAVARPARRVGVDVTCPPACLDGVGERLGEPAAAADEHELGRRSGSRGRRRAGRARRR